MALVSHPQRIQNSRLYALFWRWHFITGFFAVPILVIVALTGAAITYQDELHPLLYPQLDLVTPTGPEVALEQQLQAVLAAYPGVVVHGVMVYPPGSSHSTTFHLTLPDSAQHFFNPWNLGDAYVNPYTGAVLGLLDESQDVFGWITNLHKSFFLLIPGELAVDFATSWGVMSLLAGLYLWWPRRQEKVWGVWLPRLNRGRWLFWRDLHTVPSLYLTPTAVAVMVSGVLLGLSAAPILLTEIITRQFPVDLLSAHSVVQPGVRPLSLDAAVARMGPPPGPGPYAVGLPANAAGAYTIQYGNHTDAVNYRIAILDQYSGEFVLDYTAQTFPAGGRFYFLYIFNEVLHRGTYWGVWGKLLTFIACLLVALMSITAWVMWWRRKPTRSWGIPKTVTGAAISRWVWVTFIVCAILLPMVGLTLLLVMLGSWLVRAIKRWAGRGTLPKPAAP